MIKRVPIKIPRTPIIMPDFLKGQIKLWELTEETREEDILELSKHYDMLVMEVTQKAGHNSLSVQNYTEHKNWIHYERVYEICRMKGWDGRLYIEAQFERSKNWKRMRYPLPHTMYSTNALFFFTNHLSSIMKKYEQDTRGLEKQKGRDTKTMREIMVDDIVRSIKHVSDAIEATKSTDKAQFKALRIFQTWAELSPYYLYSIPWFHDVIKELDGRIIEKYRQEFDKISNSPMMKNVINDTVPLVEEHYKLPENIQF